MKKKELIKKGLLASFCAFMMLGDVMEVEAAPMTEVTFDAEYYYNNYPDLQAAVGNDASALYNHYLQYGLKEGRSGSAEFNCKTYINNYEDLRNTFQGDISSYCTHYEQFGKNEGRNASSQIDPNANFAEEIMRNGIISQEPIVQEPSVEEPTVQEPTAEQKALSFDAEYYYNTYPDLQATIGYDEFDLYIHYLQYGIREGRSGSADFNCKTYINNYEDLRNVFKDDIAAYCTHYEQIGKKEGRNASLQIDPSVDYAGEILNRVLGIYSTKYDATIPRAKNVQTAASRVNSVVVQPRGNFSFNKTVLPRTPENGYVKAPIISGGRYTTGYGGGICQVSSTLYAAMLNAELPATERYPHSLPVSYMPVGMDATISGNSKDLKFKNIFSNPIQLIANTDTATGRLTVSIIELK